MPAAAKGEGRVWQYLRGVWRRRVAIVLAVLVIVGFSMVISSSRPTVYEATAEVLVQSSGVELALDPASRPRTEPDRLVETEIRILASPEVKDQVRTSIGEAPPVSASAAGDADVITIRARSSSAERAATTANAYADGYVTVRHRQVDEAVNAAAAEIQKRVTELQSQVDGSQGEARDVAVAQQTALRQQLDRVQVLRAVKSGAAEVVTPAALPTSPVSPRPGRAGLLAGLGGLGLALAVALLLERVDDSLRTKDQLARAADLPVIGTIPTVGTSLTQLGRPQVVSLTTPRSPATEAYRTLRTAVQFLPMEGVTMIQVTSPTAGDGKTTTLANLGVALARAGQQVALVCCDLRRPKLHEFFGMTNDIGFTSVLLGKVPLSAALQQVPDQDRLYVLASGPLPPNPSELLSSRRAREVLASLRAEAEIVLIDSPPVLPVSDAMIIAGLVDVTFIVCAADRTSTRDVTRAVEQLRQVGAPLMGAILNGAGPESAYGGKYGYDTLEAPPAAETAGAATGAKGGSKSSVGKSSAGRAGLGKSSKATKPLRAPRPALPPAAEDRDTVAKRRS